MEFSHVSVMVGECLEVLMPERGGIFVDCTCGGGGHSLEIAKRLPANSRLVCLDRDDAALAAAEKRLSAFSDKVTLVKSNFENLTSVLDSLGIEKIDGVMWDLGVSSYQLDEASRGFSYMNDAPLDMRMDKSAGKSAADVVNTYSEGDLRRIISDYGEERFAAAIAKNIVLQREKKPLETTFELVDVITRSIPAKSRRTESKHPAKRTFQAIRIEVNGELEVIEPSVEGAVSRLNVGGRAAVITFHSGEDRIVKQTFKRLENPCICPKDFPVCVCGLKPQIRLLSKKAIAPSTKEIEINPRARSAKLRAAEKI